MRIFFRSIMTMRHRGRKWHCIAARTIDRDYVSPPQATQWPAARSRHARQWLGCENSVQRCAFPISKTSLALIDAPRTLRDMKKDCGKQDCPNDRLGQGTRIGYEVSE